MDDSAPAGKQWKAVPVEDRRRSAGWSLAVLVGGTALVWWVQASSGEFAAHWWYLWPVWLVFVPAVPFYWFRKRRLVPTPAIAQATASAAADQQRKTEEMERKWWFRYGLAALMLVGAWLVLERNTQSWWLAAVLVLVAAVQARELSIAVLGIALVVGFLMGVAALPVSLAIVLGAAMIAYGVMRSRDPDLDTKLPLVGKYVQQRREAKQVRELLASPFFATLQVAIEAFWTTQPLVVAQLGVDLRESVRKLLVEEGMTIAQSANSAMENRKRLADAVVEVGRLQVLVLPPPPEPDETGYRGQMGVSGELKARTLEIVHANKEFRDWMHPDAFGTWETAWSAVLVRYWTVLARANVLSALRKPLGDYDASRVPDWYTVFIATQCAYWENQFRKSIGIPPSLPPEKGWGELTGLKYSLFYNCVMDGATFPDDEWRQRCLNVVNGTGNNAT